MRPVKLTKREIQEIDRAIELFQEDRELFAKFAIGLMEHLGNDEDLSPYIHFMKYRIKDPEHLRKKLERKAIERKTLGEKPDINSENLYTKVTDLLGIRILHLHTEQMKHINEIILSILEKHQYPLFEEPKASCWDIEYEKIFKQFSIATGPSDSMYTSVHYIIEVNERTKITAELQVRTLMDEVWGEVSHRINYPNESSVQSCQDQLKVLARLTTGCTRLVDSIFKSESDSKSGI